MNVLSKLFLVSTSVFPSIVLAVSMQLTTLDGQTKTLDEYKGKWVVVNYWATWCPPCIEEIPELNSFHEKNADRAVMLGLNQEDISREDLNSFIEEYFMEYPQFKVSPRERSPLGSVPGLPTTFVITPNGELVAKQSGPVSEKMLTDFIDNWGK